LVDGVAGPAGLPGLILNETTGAGVQTGPVSSPSDIAANFVPSIRSFLQTSVTTIATAIAGPTGVAVPRAVASNSLKNRAGRIPRARAHVGTRART